MTAILGPNRTHGKTSTYNAGCRCRDCRRAAREHRARYRSGALSQHLRACPACGDWFFSVAGHEWQIETRTA